MPAPNLLVHTQALTLHPVPMLSIGHFSLSLSHSAALISIWFPLECWSRFHHVSILYERLLLSHVYAFGRCVRGMNLNVLTALDKNGPIMMKRYQKYVVLLKQVMIILQKSFLFQCIFLVYIMLIWCTLWVLSIFVLHAQFFGQCKNVNPMLTMTKVNL